MNKKVLGIAAAATVALLVPVVCVGGFLVSSMQVIYGGVGSLGCVASGSDDATGTQPSAGATTAAKVEVGDGKTLSLNADQQNNAATIISVAKDLNVPSRGVEVAFMVALQESSLRNLANTTVPESLLLDHDGTGSDHDSVGFFQQRANWGSVANRLNPTYEAKAFFGGPQGPNHGSPRGLLDIANWQTKSLGAAAQAVQVSAAPTAYSKWQSTAEAIMSDSGITVTADTSVQTASNGGGCSTDSVDSADTSSSAGAQTASWTAPNGKTGADLVGYAEQFVGKVPYSSACGSAGSPTAGWCCTGFVYYVYHQVLGIDLPSPVVSGQLAKAHQISASQAKAGDLVAWVGHHIGIYDGAGGLLHSPDWGRKLTHAKSYKFDIDGTGPTFWRVNAIDEGKS